MARKKQNLEEREDGEGKKRVEDKAPSAEEFKEKAEEKKELSAEAKYEKQKSEESKIKEEKPELEREYIINLRREVIKVPRYRRAKKAIRALKEFLARHMKVEKRDISKVKIDKYLNEEIWHRGIKKPLMKFKVKAKKIKGVVYAELAELPKVLEFKKKKEEKFWQENLSSVEKKVEEKTRKKEDIETKEKEASTVEAGLDEQKKSAKESKHQIKEKHKKTMPVRKALQR